MSAFKSVLMFLLIIGIQAGIWAQEREKELTLQDAIVTALDNNLDLKIEIQTRDYFWESLRSNQAIFVPNLNIEYQRRETNRPSSGILSGADVEKQGNDTLNVGLSQQIALGGTLNVSLQNSRSTSNSAFTTINPALYSTLTLSISQPLLKNFGTLATKKDIYIAANEYRKNDLSLKQAMIDLVYQVEEAYWNLVYAHQNLDAKKQSLLRARDLLRQNEKKVRVGAAARIDILEAKAEVASYESQLLEAEKNILTAEEQLKKILNISQSAEVIMPTDSPEVRSMALDFNAFLQEAMDSRPDILQARIELESHNIRVKYARNQMLPDLQLTASYYTTGRGGDQLIFDPDSSPFDLNRPVIGVISKDVIDALEEVVSNLYRNYSIGIKLSVPLGQAQEKARLAQARIDMKRALLNLQRVENTIFSDLKQALKELEANRKLVESNQIALELQAQKLKAEEKKLSVGMSTNYQVLNYQRDYANAQAGALQSTINFNLTLARINRIIARNLEEYGIHFNDFQRD
ncbi:MAG TPA: TolC family protein [Candidatus Aminicenantes bacterium]|nr:TolC family protein [Candidatus Aminicenantes bacterium]